MKEEKSEWICLEEVDSTNEYAKRIAGEKANAFVLAKRQSGGRGTKGRSFSSEEGGVYLSALRFFEDFPAKDAFLIMAGAAVAVCRVAQACGLHPKIKWPNDILVDGKKICGILIENTFSAGKITSSIVGIGLNVCNPLPEELTFATSIARSGGRVLPVEEVARMLARELGKGADMQEYRQFLGLTGRGVTLLLEGKRVPARLHSVTDSGELVVEIAGEEKILASAEVEYASWEE